jgi:peptidoglycan/xylan/chitin deacetylase (PgdA/CDA1 family)
MGRMAGHMGPVVLTYHSVERTSGTPAWQFAVSLERFREQIGYLLSEGWSFLRLDQLGSGRSANSKQVVITFDDSYTDTLHAAEVLARFGLQASWFVVSGAMCGRCTWVNEGEPQRPTLVHHQLRELAEYGMEIGAHSRTHRRLAQIDPMELDCETAQCKNEIEDAVGKAITSFSYPYSSYDATVIQSVKRAGFERACTTENGTARVDAEKFTLPRLGITGNDTISDFARKIFILNDHPGIKGVVRSARRIAGRCL